MAYDYSNAPKGNNEGGKPAPKGKGGFGGRKGGFGNKDRKPFGDKPRGDRKFGNKDGRKFDRKDGEGRDGKRFERRDGERRFDRKDGERKFERRDGGRKFDKPRGDKPFGKKPRQRDLERSANFKKRFEGQEGAEEAKQEQMTAQADQAENTAAEQAVQGEAAERPAKKFDRKGDRGTRGGKRGFKKEKLSPGRAAAAAIGRVVREREAFTAEVTPAVLARFEGISPEDAAFATKLSRGVTATLGTLDEFINRNMRTPDDIDANIRDAMRVSAYEMLFLKKSDYAAVDQGVELVRTIEPKATGLANTVLRKMSRSARAFPFGNPNLSLQVLARSEAFPLWMAKRLMNEMGLQQATAFMHACNADAPVYIAVNAIKATDEEVEDVFDQAGSLLKAAEDVPGCYLMSDARVLRKPEVRALFEQGKVFVSDESAQAIALLACPDEAPESFLEIGSGRGTKTILMQSNAQRLYGKTVQMTSVDDHAFKGEVLAKRVAAYGIETVMPHTADARYISRDLPEESFDAVFVDAPCSGVGTLRRHPEIRWRLTENDVERMATVGCDILIEAAKMVKPGGLLTYATCTVFMEENERVVERFLRTKFGEEFEVEKTLATTLTPIGPDAHYAVRMRRAK